MPTAAEVLQDPKFLGLPVEERRKVLTQVDTTFGTLPGAEQDKVLNVKPDIGLRPASALEGLKSRVHQLFNDPIGALSEKFSDPRGVPYSGDNDTLSESVIGGIGAPKLPGAETAARFAKAYIAPKPGGRLARAIEAAQGAKDPISTPVPSGIDPEAWAKLPEEVRHAVQTQAARRAAGIGYKPAPAPSPASATAPKIAPEPVFNPKTATFSEATPVKAPEDPYIYQEDGRPLMKKGSEAPDDLPPAGTPKRAPRSTAEAQQRSDEIAALNRHADTVPLAQKAVQDGVTSKDLLALPPEAKADFMKRIGLEGRSDATWRTFVGHVLRLEKLGKK